MATAKPKVKRMMLGGAALGGVKKAVAAKAAPMLQQAKQLQAAKSAAPNQTTFVGGKPTGPMVPPKQMATMSDSLRRDYADKLNQLTSQRPSSVGGAEAKKLGLSAGPMPPQVRTGTSSAADAAAALRKLPMNPPMPGKAGPKPLQTLGAAGVPARGISRGDLKMAGIGAAGAARGMMKKGGAVKKKATKK